MDIHERLEAFWLGEKPDRIPYTIYAWNCRGIENDGVLLNMCKNGLGITHPITPFNAEYNDVELIDNTDGVIRQQIMRTSDGDIFQTWKNGWHDQYLLKTADDYRIMTSIVRKTVLTPRDMSRLINGMNPYDVPLLAIGRTPLQTIMVDFAGLENFAFHLFDFEDEVQELYDALLEQFRRRIEIAALAPGHFISNLENFTSESLGAERYEKFLLPVYEECFPILHDAGKIVGTHYDGRTACCKELIARAPMDMIESLTEPNEGDLTIAEARAAWPNKLFWCNIRVGDYQLSAAELKTKVFALLEDGCVNACRMAFEVSEHLPENWRDSMPVVLDALDEFA